MKINIDLSLEKMITWLLLVALTLFGLMIWIELNKLEYLNQQRVNTQNIQAIVNVLTERGIIQVPQQPIPQQPKEEIK